MNGEIQGDAQTRLLDRQPHLCEATSSGLGRLEFPNTALVGSLGDLAHLLAHDTEVPEEFYFAAALTLFGAIAGTRLRLSVAFDVEPRLYTVLLGESYSVKKSTAMKKTIAFFKQHFPNLNTHVVYGAASAEGLAREMEEHNNLVLAYDELRSFIDKCHVRDSTLLPMVTSLFEGNHWQNPTKNRSHSVYLDNAHLSLLGCCTLDTYAQMWTPDAIGIGLPNRLFIVNADRRAKVAWPKPPDEASVQKIADRIRGNFAGFLWSLT